MTTLYEREAQSISRLAHLRFYPLAVRGGAGTNLITDDGRELLDFAASWGAASLGHSDPRIRAAVDRALSNQAGASYLSSANAATVELAEKLLSLVPNRAAGRIWFGHSGSDANETVARIAVAATGRPRIISFSGAYHGGTTGSAAISGHPSQVTPRAPSLTLVPYPNTFAVGKEAAQASLAELDRLFAGPVPPQDVAAFFIEPIQSDGGMLVPPPGFFKEIEQRCRKHGILLVSDEVKVGLGRTGRLHAFSHHGIEPDIVVFGKGLGGGLPISAIAGPVSVMNFAPAFSFQTLHGNPVCAAAALAVLEAIRIDRLVENAAMTGAHLFSRLESLKQRHSLIGDVRGQGLAIGLELVTDRVTKKPAKREAAMAVYRAFQTGLVLFYVGVNSNVLELTPPLTLTREEADRGVELLDVALTDVEQGRVDPSLAGAFAGW
ncbi:aspartate aminotransferase family protein [Bradyrhizobium yuanmingense]|uniref:aspartate aminotransferase family protein n=1 Tax=Bradyrhizobium yuanmingense TaxID=108015 RepID=UPI0023BA26B6|nr:aspartate aminotransferase family protein [Bradyrhizobium yuanmingense]MDF0498428.1 aspartate aminotransferase family protein [Bradyrhizobium yuanmingense]